MKRRGKFMLAAGIILFIIACIVIFWKIPYSPYKSRFVKQMEQKVQNITKVEQICTKQDIETLPEPLQRYCKYIGLEGFPKYQALRTQFSHTRFVMDDAKGVLVDMDYDLWLFYDQPFRSAYCQSIMKGIPFDGIDYCTEKKEGGMKGILGKLIKIFDAHNTQGYQAGIISWFAESLTLNPSVLFSPYITYEVQSNNEVKVTITYQGVTGTGLIRINDDGAITEFYSDDRQVEKINGQDTKIGWRCDYLDYRKENGILQAHRVSSVKVYPEKEVVYFDSDHFNVEYMK